MFIVALASTMLPSVYRTIISLDKTTASLEAWEVNPLPTLVLDTGVVLHTNPAAKHTLGHEIEDIGQRLTYADETQDTITVKGKTYQVIGSEIEENLKLIMLRDITDRLTLDRLKRYCGELLLKEFEERIRNVSSYIESGGTQQKAIQSILKAISDVAKDANLITRIVSGEDVRIGKETVHLRNLIEETLALYKTLTDDRNITIALNIPESIRVVANRQLLARTLRKVLGKILDAMPQNGKMSIRARMSDDTVVIELSSTSTDDTHAKINMDVETEIIRGLMDGDIRVEFDWRRNLAVITIMLPRG
jgi:signal transduction histidine kinase